MYTARISDKFTKLLFKVLNNFIYMVKILDLGHSVVLGYEYIGSFVNSCG